MTEHAATTASETTQAKPPDPFYFIVVKGMAEGRVVPFLGAGASLCDRPENASYDPANPAFLPSAKEVARFLSDEFVYGDDGDADPDDLLRVAQYVEVVGGRDWLYEKLHQLFAADYAPNSLHRFLATLPGTLLAGKDRPPKHQLVVTTNWDTALEDAFREADQPFHLVWYVAEGDERGKFRHRMPDTVENGVRKSGPETLVEKPNEYVDVSTAEYPVVLKIHGAVDPTTQDWDRDSYVVSEDHYIDYLTDGTNITSLVPVELAKQLQRASFLFLGYSLRDWNFRVILNRIFRNQKRSTESWAIQRDVRQFDEKFWARRGVTLRDEDLAAFIRELARHVDAYPRRPVPA